MIKRETKPKQGGASKLVQRLKAPHMKIRGGEKLVGYFIYFSCDEGDKGFFISGSNAANEGQNWDRLRNSSRLS